MTTMDRIAAHKRTHVLRHYHHVTYIPNMVCCLADVDISGKGRFVTIVIIQPDWPMTMADLADRCDALPGAGRKGLAA